jgi:hypothetical protein
MRRMAMSVVAFVMLTAVALYLVQQFNAPVW